MTDITEDLLAAQHAAAPKRSVGRIIARAVWTLALILLGGLLAMGTQDIQTATSAPQQAAAAASMACFRIIGIYTFARAMDALWR